MKSNVTQAIKEKVGRNLHQQKNHPIEIIKREIYSVLGEGFKVFDNLNPYVSVENNFDALLIPKDHPSRKSTDTYYLNENTVLRTHTSAHQHELLCQGNECFLVVGDVYRRDEIDKYHYPVFHQMEGVKICSNPQEDLLNTLTKLVKHLFPNCEYRITESYFPFTNPSYEIEVFWKDKWIEVLGCGVIHPSVLERCVGKNPNLEGKVAWAFGLGLERLAMILFEIPDIRLFWTTDNRFHQQFQGGEIVKFREYSKHPACFKDISFWINDLQSYNYNDLCDAVRNTGVDLVEDITLIDTFTDPKSGLISHCYRISYRSNERSLTNEEVNEIYSDLRNSITESLNITLR